MKESYIRQKTGERRRRLFQDKEHELYVWYEKDDSLFGFQYIFKLSDRAKLAATWTRDEGWMHHAVTDADGSMAQTEADLFDRDRIYEEFVDVSVDVEPAARRFVQDRLSEHSTEFAACKSCKTRNPANNHCAQCHERICDPCRSIEGGRNHTWYDQFLGSFGCEVCKARRGK